jgi:hypothetical protein
MPRRFSVSLNRPSFGIITKKLGTVTILDSLEPIPEVPPEPELANNFIWECIFENMSGANFQSLAHSCEEGYEYMCAHIDYRGGSEIVWSSVALFKNDRASGTFIGQAMDSGVVFGSTISIDRNNGKSTIIRVLRRILVVANSEETRVTGNEFVKVGSGLNHQWDLDYEYYITCYSGSQNFTASIVTDSSMYEGHDKIDKNHAFIASVHTQDGKWVGFEHKKSDKYNRSFRKLRTKNCSVGNIWRRPWKSTSQRPGEYANEWRRVRNFISNAQGSTSYAWEDNKEYLVVLDDRNGNWEIATTKVITLPGLLSVPGVDRHKSGIASSAGAYSWVEFLQTSSGGSKKVSGRWDGKILSILERTLYLDKVSCFGELPEAESPTSPTFMADTPVISRYGTKTFNLDPSSSEAYVGAYFGNQIPDTYNDKYSSTMVGIAIPINSDETRRTVVPSNAYKAETQGSTSSGWYLSVLDAGVHEGGLKYVKIEGLAVSSHAEEGHLIKLTMENIEFFIDSNMTVSTQNESMPVSLQTIYAINSSNFHIKFEDSMGNNKSGIDAEATVAMKFEFNDGTSYSHLLVLSVNSGGY